MMLLLTQWCNSTLVCEPARRHGYRTVAAENGIDLRHVGAADLPAESAQVLSHLGGRAESDQCGADDRVPQGPAQRELRQTLAVIRGQGLQFLDRGEVAREMLWAEQGSEQIQGAEHAALRAPVALIELHSGVKRAAQHPVRQ